MSRATWTTWATCSLVLSSHAQILPVCHVGVGYDRAWLVLGVCMCGFLGRERACVIPPLQRKPHMQTPSTSHALVVPQPIKSHKRGRLAHSRGLTTGHTYSTPAHPLAPAADLNAPARPHAHSCTRNPLTCATPARPPPAAPPQVEAARSSSCGSTRGTAGSCTRGTGRRR